MTAVIIGGHQRSGTTILTRVLAQHPQVGLTLEFANFQGLQRSFRHNLRLILKRWRIVSLRNGFLAPSWLKRANFIRNNGLIPLYLLGLLRSPQGLVELPAIERALGFPFPRASLVGDKYPDYVFQLDRLLVSKDLQCIIIYRDARDVTSSALVQARTNWKNKQYVKHFDTSAKVAARWVRAIEAMEQHRGRVLAVRYENLVREPQRELDAIASVLDLNPAGFPTDLFREDRVGKHQHGLTPEELETVMEIAGPTMERLGYG